MHRHASTVYLGIDEIQNNNIIITSLIETMLLADTYIMK